jgi:hypothetical protein
MIKYSFFDFPDSKILLKQIGTSVSQIKREDILWSAIDTHNVMMQRSNALTHFHGTLDGLVQNQNTLFSIIMDVPLLL